MFNAIRQRVRRLAGSGELMSSSPQPRASSVQLQLPNPYGGRPWLTAMVALSSVPHGHGETLRLRAHLDGCMRMPLDHRSVYTALPARRGLRQSLVAYGRSVAASVVRGIVDRLPAEQLQPLTTRRWRSWLDVQLSTSPLDAGADALMPEPLRRMYDGGLPRAGAGEPRIGVWSGPADGPAGGVAQLALLQLDERDVGRDRHQAGSGFNLNASIAQVIEPAAGGYDAEFGAHDPQG